MGNAESSLFAHFCPHFFLPPVVLTLSSSWHWSHHKLLQCCNLSLPQICPWPFASALCTLFHPAVLFANYFFLPKPKHVPAPFPLCQPVTAAVTRHFKVISAPSPHFLHGVCHIAGINLCFTHTSAGENLAWRSAKESQEDGQGRYLLLC